MRPFVQQAVDLDLNTPPTRPLNLEDLPIPTPRISDELLAELTTPSASTSSTPMILIGSCTPMVRACEI